MPEQTGWEYRVLSVGSFFGTKDEVVEAALNELGEEGWELVSAFTPENSGKVMLIAKRPLTRRPPPATLPSVSCPALPCSGDFRRGFATPDLRCARSLRQVRQSGKIG